MQSQNSTWKALLPLCSVLLIDALTFGIVIPSLGSILLNPAHSILPADTTLHVRNFLFTACLGLPMLFTFFGAPLLGDLSDQLGRKKALLFCLLGITFSCLLSAYGVMMGSVFLLIAGRCIFGFMDGSEAIAKAAIADMSTEKNKVSNMNLISLFGTVGFVVAPVLGGVLSNQAFSPFFNFLTPFYAAALFAVLNAILLWILFKETFVPQIKRKFRLLKGIQNLVLAFSDHRIRLLSMIFFCMQFAWGGYFQAITILLVEKFHYSSTQIGMFLTYIALCFVLTLTVIIRLLINRLTYQTIVSLGLLMIFFGNMLVGFTESELNVWISVVPTCVGVGLCYNTLLTLFSDAVDKDNQGQVMGVATGLFAIAWVLAALLSGLVSAVHLHLPYKIFSAVVLLGFLGSMISTKR